MSRTISDEGLRLAQAKWKSSGLTDEQAKKLKFEFLRGDETKNLSTTFFGISSLKIPYFDPRGNPTDFFRLRYLEQPSGWAGATAKPQRYAQLPGSLNEVYLPPLLPVRWEDVICDPKVPIYITEGELKAASACAQGLATIGLGGVDVWRSSKRGISLLPLLQKIQWKDRNVVVVFDSDAATNPNVVRAQRQLANELLSLGARPAIASLPPGAAGKQGLDDFIVAEGSEALIELLADAPMFSEADALWALNEEVVYITSPGFVVKRDSGQRMSSQLFVSSVYANRHYIETSISKGVPVMKKKSLAKRWLEWEHRFELSKITYAPGQPRVHKQLWNAWPGWGVEPRKGDVSPWRWLLSYLFQGEEASRQWFERWCAYPLQHPGTKLFTSAALWSVAQGTGKSLIGYTLMKIYGQNSIEIGDGHLRGSFNEWAENKQFIMGDEVTGTDKRSEADKLKRLITQEQLVVNAKYISSYTVPDCINYYFTSNHPDAFFIEDSDRRFFIHEVVNAPAEREKYREYDKWYKSEEGVAALFHYLLHLDLGDFDPTAPAPGTSAKSSMIEDSKSDLGAWVAQLKMDAYTTLSMFGERASKNCALFNATQLHKAYDPMGVSRVSVNGLSRELKRAGFRQLNNGRPIRTETGLQKLYVVRDEKTWQEASPKEISAHYNSFFGTEAAKY